jgi:hypothetical protein
VDGTPKATLVPPADKLGAVKEQRAVEKLLFLPDQARVLACLALDATVYFWRLIDLQLVGATRLLRPSAQLSRAVGIGKLFVVWLRPGSSSAGSEGYVAFL